MIVAITGANGFVGTAVIKEMIQSPNWDRIEKVYLLVRNVREVASFYSEYAKIDCRHFYFQDHCDCNIDMTLKEISRLDCMINLAANTRFFMSKTEFKRNREMAAFVAAVFFDNSPGYFIHLGSAVESCLSYGPPGNPVSGWTYAQSKAAITDYLIDSYSEKPMTILRPTLLLGGGLDDPENVEWSLYWLMRALLNSRNDFPSGSLDFLSVGWFSRLVVNLFLGSVARFDGIVEVGLGTDCFDLDFFLRLAKKINLEPIKSERERSIVIRRNRAYLDFFSQSFRFNSLDQLRDDLRSLVDDSCLSAERALVSSVKEIDSVTKIK